MARGMKDGKGAGERESQGGEWLVIFLFPFLCLKQEFF